MSAQHPHHPAVPHPVHLRLRDDAARYGKGLRGNAAVVNDWTATRLGLVFGSVWVVWVFFIWPLLAQFFDAEIQMKTSYYAQSWVQLFALPLFVYIGNKLQRSSDAQSEAMHMALSHIATVADLCADLLNLSTRGGLADVLKAVEGQRDETAMLAAAVRTLMSARTEAGEKLAAAVQESTAKVDAVHQFLAAEAPLPAPAAGSAGTAGARKPHAADGKGTS